jgi:ATP-dependent DNA ligase
VLCAFDLIELDGRDLRGAPLEDRKNALSELLPRESAGIALNRHYECRRLVALDYSAPALFEDALPTEQ